MRRPSAAESSSTDQAIQLQGRRQWNVVWAALREGAMSHHLSSLRLNVNIPHLHESFYATWNANAPAEEEPWRIVLPLTYGTRSIGRLLVVGSPGENKLVQMQHFLDFLEPLEAEMARFVEQAEADLAAGVAPERVEPAGRQLATTVN